MKHLTFSDELQNIARAFIFTFGKKRLMHFIDF